MCGIVGLFLKDTALAPALGRHLTDMLITMSDRGPDSAGIAVYSEAGDEKLTVQCGDSAVLDGLKDRLGRPVDRHDTHAVIHVSEGESAALRRRIAEEIPELRVMSQGVGIEIYKEVGLPGAVAARFDLGARTGTHGIGHTRMATESAVTTLGAHPFPPGPISALCIMGRCQITMPCAAKCCARG